MLPVYWLVGAESSRNVSPGIHRVTPVRLLYSARRARGTFIGARYSQKAGHLKEVDTTSQTDSPNKIVWCCTATDVSAGVSYLDETNVGALLAEALTADVQAVLADETSRVGADTAVSTSLATVPVYKPLYSPAPTARRAAALAVRPSCRL
jgi:hypothetical protein